MRGFALLLLVVVIFVVCGCALKSDGVRSASGSDNRQAGPGLIKQPLYKKPELTAKETAAGEKPVETRLALARKYLEEKQYDKVPPVLEEISRFDPANEEALDIADQAYYSLGVAFYWGRQFIAAEEALSHVSPDYKDTKSLLISVRGAIAKQVDFHYKRGVKYFINEELKNAIWEWEKVLALEPGHLKAAEDIQNARQLLKRIENINR